MKVVNRKRQFVLIAAALLVGLLLTRGISLDHNLWGHPDEHVFYGSTEMLMRAIFYGETPYEPIKPYPEGAYVFRLPFQLLAQKLPMNSDYAMSVAIWGRIASVFYYSIGAVLGLWLVCSVLGGGMAGAIIYVLTAVFGLFQIEQSRYGTFDPVSFMLIMGILTLISFYIRKDKKRFLYMAAFCVGVLGAGKYPLILFFVLPFSALLMKRLPRKVTFLRLCCMGVFTLAGFLLFSPSILQSPFFLLVTIKNGISGYQTGGNPEGFCTLPDKLLSFFSYHLFYSDLPAAPVFAAISAVLLYKDERKSAEQQFFAVVLPAFSLFFLTYNLLVKTFFLRTVFQFFCIAMLYACSGLGRLCGSKGRKSLAIVLCALMVARGAYFLYLLSDKGYEEYSPLRLQNRLSDEEVKRVTKMGWFYMDGFDLETLSPELNTISLDVLIEGDAPEIEEGEAILTGALEHGWAKYCVFPPRAPEIINITEQWEQFKANNEQYLVGKLFPDYIYWLLGFWVHGSTITNYEFPSNWLYFRPQPGQ